MLNVNTTRVLWSVVATYISLLSSVLSSSTSYEDYDDVFRPSHIVFSHDEDIKISVRIYNKKQEFLHLLEIDLSEETTGLDLENIVGGYLKGLIKNDRDNVISKKTRRKIKKVLRSNRRVYLILGSFLFSEKDFLYPRLSRQENPILNFYYGNSIKG